MSAKEVLMAMLSAGGILFGAVMFTVIGLAGLVGALSTGNYWMLTMCFMFVGSFFFFQWAFSEIDDALQYKKAVKNLQDRGVETTAEVTLVDYDWSFTVNNKPVNSIVEYTFLDANNLMHRGQDRINTDTVRRAGLSSGDTIYVSYDPADPGVNAIAAKQSDENVTDVEPEPQNNTIEHKIHHASGVEKEALDTEGVEAVATIISLQSDETYTTFIWKFEDVSGQAYKQQYTVLNDFVIKNRIHINARLKIKYLPANPNKCAFVETLQPS